MARPVAKTIARSAAVFAIPGVVGERFLASSSGALTAAVGLSRIVGEAVPREQRSGQGVTDRSVLGRVCRETPTGRSRPSSRPRAIGPFRAPWG